MFFTGHTLLEVPVDWVNSCVAPGLWREYGGPGKKGPKAGGSLSLHKPMELQVRSRRVGSRELVGVPPAVTLPFRKVESGVVEPMGRSLASDLERGDFYTVSRGRGS